MPVARRPTPEKIAAFLRRARAAVAAKHIEFSGYAVEGIDALRWTDAQAKECIQNLVVAEHDHCEPSTVYLHEVIWVFAHATVDIMIEDDEEAFIWIRLIERGGIFVVSFHQSRVNL